MQFALELKFSCHRKMVRIGEKKFVGKKRLPSNRKRALQFTTVIVFLYIFLQNFINIILFSSDNQHPEFANDIQIVGQAETVKELADSAPNESETKFQHELQSIVENHGIPSKSATLPQWITDYIEFHNQARKQFPGKELFTNPDAPNLLIRLCLGVCGGLHDRLGHLPLDLHIANQTNRVLLIMWHKPHPLENYLLPNQINWTVPWGVDYDDMHQARSHTFLPLENGYTVEDLDNVIQQMQTGDLSSEKLLNSRILADERGESLSYRLKAAGETDMIDDTLTFGGIFWSLFKIHPNVQRLIDEQKQSLHLSTSNYIAVHCRTRHPKGWSKKKPPPRAEVPEFPADRSDIVFEGYEKEHTVSVATHALQCARTLLRPNHLDEAIYLTTDSFQVTNFMLSQDSVFYGTNLNITVRDDSVPSIHIDRKKGRPIEEHYGTFVDLFLMVEARCIDFGIGNFARLAAKISGTECLIQHREVEWDTHNAPRWFARPCRMGDGVDESKNQKM